MDQSEEITAAQRNRIERNRQKAIVIKRSKLVHHPYSNKSGEAASTEKTVYNIQDVKFRDTGGGFLIEEKETTTSFGEIVDKQPPILEKDSVKCRDCDKFIQDSYLFNTFNFPVCDSCKDDEKHNLITRTDALKEYLLKPCDVDKREPILKYIERKNPHNQNWNKMKLYLQLQVEERALEVWGSKEELESELEKRDEKRVLTKTKKYHKKMKELRMNVRSSLFDRTTSASHKHAFGPETYIEDSDEYSHVCLTCGFEETFEKM